MTPKQIELRKRAKELRQKQTEMDLAPEVTSNGKPLLLGRPTSSQSAQSLRRPTSSSALSRPSSSAKATRYWPSSTPRFGKLTYDGSAAYKLRNNDSGSFGPGMYDVQCLRDGNHPAPWRRPSTAPGNTRSKEVKTGFGSLTKRFPEQKEDTGSRELYYDVQLLRTGVPIGLEGGLRTPIFGMGPKGRLGGITLYDGREAERLFNRNGQFGPGGYKPKVDKFGNPLGGKLGGVPLFGPKPIMEKEREKYLKAKERASEAMTMASPRSIFAKQVLSTSRSASNVHFGSASRDSLSKLHVGKMFME